ncbi:MAG TPA: hypothetical protein PK325_18135 [Cyclobacteriaceae bacterium]|nr:hypothetical protein [Cyclobacteriaceae bacterium]HMV11156.1 hypothetical protein [Cyclobacteriaceae bacterium]HMX01824.1 hypothetical protein [Cyclobacteriaceae bacterium]HMX52161.1 hypothetical protein [Cyclobacteriaceae bacterium]HMY94648.1 hypothetical protein [Cyclobacteriaceae bacterium]
MIAELSRLSSGEQELVYKAPLLVCILIAGADGNIDRKEIKKAINIAQKKQKGSDPVSVLFKELAQDFEDKLKIIEQGYPYEATQRTPLISDELKELNKLWQKLPQSFSKGYYDMLVMLAKEVAASSGGLLGMNKIGSEEARLVKLTMIQNPVAG